jgi:hypothetical protein
LTRRVLVSALVLALAPAAAQQSAPEFSLRDFPERMKSADAACAADPAGAECRVQMMSVLPTAVEALSFLGYQDTYDEAAPLLREFADFPVPQVQAAAIFALARLGPKPEDLPALRTALLSDVPAVRRAAIGALQKLADPAAQELYARAAPNPDYLPSGSDYRSESLPFDPAAAGIAKWPDGVRYLFFQRLARQGTYVFTTTADAAATLALFESQAAAKAVGMGEIAARFGGAHGDLLAGWIDRNQRLGAVQGVVLKDGSDGTPTLLALVYEDYALGATGFALVRLPGEPLPEPSRPAESAAPPPAPTGDAAIWFAGGRFEPKPGAAADDIAAWREVQDAEGDGAAAYLEAFPQGAYRAEAQALLDAPTLETDQDIYAETDTIKVQWRGVPVGVEAKLTLGHAGDQSLSDTAALQTPAVAAPAGDTELTYYPFIEAGVYDLRLVGIDGEAIATTQIRIALAAATLTLSETSVKPGASLQIAYAGMAGTPRDYLSIAKADEPPEQSGAVRLPTDGKAEGSLSATAPSEPGEYEVRAWFNGENRLRARVKFTVRGPDLPPEPADLSQPSITLAHGEFTANEKIAVRFAGFLGDGSDYVALAPAGAPNATYFSYVYTQGKKDGIIEFPLPAEPGAYELRAFFANKTDVIHAAAPFTIVAPAGAAMATLALAKTDFAPGETIGIDFTGMSGSQVDYVAVAPTGARYGSFDNYVYTKGATAGHAELKAPTSPGTYEVRAFFNDQEDILRGAVTITVTAPP